VNGGGDGQSKTYPCVDFCSDDVVMASEMGSEVWNANKRYVCVWSGRGSWSDVLSSALQT